MCIVGYRDNLVACKTCGRTFAEDRIKFHEKVCVKVANIKRKKFDAMTFRVRGTELEPFAKKSLTKKQEVGILSSFINLSFHILRFFSIPNFITFKSFDSQYKQENDISIF